MKNSWHDYFLQMCDTVATRSKDTSVKVGCVIVGPDHGIRSTGYNGFPRGMADSIPETDLILDAETRIPQQSLVRRADEIRARFERPMKYKVTEHSERNAIYNAARHGTPLEGCELYCTSNPPFPPCTDCSRAIIQSGIVAVHLRPCTDIPDRWKEDCRISLDMLAECGVRVEYHGNTEPTDVRGSDEKIANVPSDEQDEPPSKNPFASHRMICMVTSVVEGVNFGNSHVPMCPYCHVPMSRIEDSPIPRCTKCGMQGSQQVLSECVGKMGDESYRNYFTAAQVIG